MYMSSVGLYCQLVLLTFGTTENRTERRYFHVKVLVVQEIDGHFKGTGVWKLPTGVIHEVRL